MALTDKLTAIANAIRAKTGKSDSLTLDQMPTEIASIETGGGSSADVRYVTFRNESTGEEFVKPVAYGDDCVDVVAKGLWKKPTKESTAQYNNTFYGWGASDGGAADANILKNITEDTTVYAIFTATVRYYTITYYDEDGTTVLHTETLAYGAMPSYVPVKSGYTFDGWTTEIVAVTGEASYVAIWIEDVVKYTLENNVLTISGSGAMDDYSSTSGMPWYSSISKITSVVVKNGISHIGQNAFYGCTALTSVTIPASVKTIGKQAFYNCTALNAVYYDSFEAFLATEPYRYTGSSPNEYAPNIYFGGELFTDNDLVFPEGTTRIPNYAFYAFSTHTGITSVTLPSTIESIGTFGLGYVRYGNCHLENAKVYVPSFAVWCQMDVDGSRGLMGRGCELYCNGELFAGGDVVIPDGVTKIGSQIFNCYVWNVSPITSVTFPDSVKSIGDYSFYHCVSLADIQWGSGVTSIGINAFCFNTAKEGALTSVTIPDSVVTIGQNAFYNNTAFTSVVIGSGVEFISKYAFNTITSATFKDTTTWVAKKQNYGDVSLSSSSLANATTAATYLVSTWQDRDWYKT